MDRSLRQFLAIADAGSITAAARALNVTQPTLTVNMQRLEREVGVPLLTRTFEGVRLTSYGEMFRDKVRQMQRLYDNAVIDLRDTRERAQTGISMACGYTWWSLFVRLMVREYHAEHPSAPIKVNIGDQIQCMDQLISGDISLFVSNEFDGLKSNVGAKFIPLSQSRTGYFVRAGHPLLAAPQLRADILSHPLAITAPPENRFRGFMNETQRLESISVVFEHSAFSFASNSMAACVDYVQNTEAVLAHTRLMADTFRELGLHEIEQLEPKRPQTVGIYLLAEQANDRRVHSLVERVISAGRSVLPPLEGR
ncbi:hypothetical protein GCM10007989_16630 [Devosia pacifica]|uniref:HTH lysR-type domain-containing protein n=1 Tax=Devosia pacifica TaxID=1335967 RepID=A0A918S3G1_9HYPH|nr:LysR family transcriptional regulator [Devosia pacifica]GHA21954.1 hypothetical protein GCM10007989_16630 [Devosia pacifica]